MTSFVSCPANSAYVFASMGLFKLTKNDFILVTGGLLIKELGKHGYATH